MHLHPDSTAAAGYCDRCAQTHSLPMGPALSHALELMDRLAESQRLDYDLPWSESNPALSTDILYTRMGQMFGVLVAVDPRGQEVVLRAFSYKHNDLWNVPGWAPSLQDGVAYDLEVLKGNALIHPLTAQIQEMSKEDPLRAELVQRRKEASHQVMDALYSLYGARNFQGDFRPLREVFRGPGGMPMGAGDCCAPKLLCEAARLGLRPVGMAEFYWGRPTLDGLRREGRFYPACTRRCQPILGFLLCGAHS